ncbi:DNA polymerase II large subunit [Rhodococcus ruber BKS 20-38]|uniref:DNA polymerase II large subunit n=1 Tax=Rhodococcus ruber BKS 20-38 TaxID=1278076 RepID=M2XMH8_9NOCA|nr:DNA polymerase II large subunit [Rhodococcus ruber BKS 20-38]
MSARPGGVLASTHVLQDSRARSPRPVPRRHPHHRRGRGTAAGLGHGPGHLHVGREDRHRSAVLPLRGTTVHARGTRGPPALAPAPDDPRHHVRAVPAARAGDEAAGADRPDRAAVSRSPLPVPAAVDGAVVDRAGLGGPRQHRGRGRLRQCLEPARHRRHPAARRADDDHPGRDVQCLGGARHRAHAAGPVRGGPAPAPLDRRLGRQARQAAEDRRPRLDSARRVRRVQPRHERGHLVEPVARAAARPDGRVPRAARSGPGDHVVRRTAPGFRLRGPRDDPVLRFDQVARHGPADGDGAVPGPADRADRPAAHVVPPDPAAGVRGDRGAAGEARGRPGRRGLTRSPLTRTQPRRQEILRLRLRFGCGLGPRLVRAARAEVGDQFEDGRDEVEQAADHDLLRPGGGWPLVVCTQRVQNLQQIEVFEHPADDVRERSHGDSSLISSVSRMRGPGMRPRRHCYNRTRPENAEIGEITRTADATRPGPPKWNRASKTVGGGSEVHATHAAGRVAGGSGGLLRLVGDDSLGGQEQGRDGRRVLQRRAGDLDRIVDAGAQQVLILAGGGVEAVAGGQVAHLLGDDAGLEAGVEGDLLQRSLEGDLDDVGTGGLVTLELQVVQNRGGLQQRDAAAGDDALLDRSLGVADGILDAVLALLELDLGGGTGLDDRDTAGQLGQALLQLLAVVVRVRRLDLGADLVHATGDGVGVAGTVDDGGLVLGDDDLARTAEQLEAGGLEGETDLFADDLATGEDGDVGELGLATVTEAGGLDGDRLEGATDLVDDQGGQSLTLDVLGDDRQRLAGLDDLLQQRQQVLDGRDLARHEQDVGVFEHGLLTLGVGGEVQRDVALVEAHTLGQLELEAEGVGLLDGDDAFLAHLVDGLGDQFTDRGVARGDAGGGADLLLGLDLLGGVEQLGGDGLDGLLDAALEAERVRTGSDVAQTLAHQRLGEHGGGGGAVTRDVVRLLGNFLDQLGADLLVRVLELDLLGDGHTIVGDRGGAPLLLEHDVATLGPQRHLDSVGEAVQAPLEAATGLFVERDDLGHCEVILRIWG